MSAGRRLGLYFGVLATPERVDELRGMSHWQRFVAALDMSLVWALVVALVVGNALTRGLQGLPDAVVAGGLVLVLAYGARALVRRRRRTT